MKDWLKIEAVLFGSGKYLTEDEISTLSGVAKKNLKHALSELKKHYSSIESSLDIFNEGNAWKLNVREDFASIVKNVISEAEMPKAIMETLALIAYKSPVLQSEIIDSRGSGAYDHIALLEEKGFVSREKSGRSFKLRIAPKFFEYFDIDGDSKLRQMMKNVKKPENLGNLEVYTAKSEEEKEVEFSDKILERMKKVEETPNDHAEKEKFLNNFETKYSKARTAIDETDGEMNEFRRIQPHEQPIEGNPEDPDNILKKFDNEIAKLDSVSVKEKEESGLEEKEVPSEEAQESEQEESEDLPEEKEAEESPAKEPHKKKVSEKSHKDVHKDVHRGKEKEGKSSKGKK